MENNFEQISKVSGFMKHNGGLLFRDLSKTEFEFKSTIQKIHLNRRNITCLLYTSPSPRDQSGSRMPSSA